ncbi:isochorismatase family protein [Actinoplanes sp. Pm04-4]|uniref:Isochorismatase family protein n=1 Tax=Paractinoplanes pyxinae TaxID=2997416 RepID=A0ABT4B4M5_9ACTN|nr:isochorismatase family protein [Actinoplanes pyxinae]MCY1141441.1 isochorismatase family protein [Actinoplanes pyxinae]
MSKLTRRHALQAAGAAGITAATTAAPAHATEPAGTRSRSNPLFSPENSALVLIDYQPEMLSTVTSMDTKLLELNVRALARSARLLNVPTVLTTVGVKAGVNHPTIASLRQEVPDLVEYDRMTMNTWEDPAVHRVIKQTGRHNLVFAALYTEICLAYPVVNAQADGYRTMFAADAVGGMSPVAHDIAIKRMIQAGAIPNTWLAVVTEWVRSWDSKYADTGREIGAWYVAELGKLHLR